MISENVFSSFQIMEAVCTVCAFFPRLFLGLRYYKYIFDTVSTYATEQRVNRPDSFKEEKESMLNIALRELAFN